MENAFLQQQKKIVKTQLLQLSAPIYSQIKVYRKIKIWAHVRDRRQISLLVFKQI